MLTDLLLMLYRREGQVLLAPLYDRGSTASYPEIEKEIGLAVQECSRGLRRFLSGRRRRAEEQRKQEYIQKYIPHIGEALQDILGFSDGERTKVIDKLTEVLEKSRKG